MKPVSHYIINEGGPVTKFDAHINGVLLNTRSEIIPVPFGQGLKIDGDSKFILESHAEESLLGVYRDKLSVRVQNDEPLLVLSKKAQELMKEFCPEIEFYDLDIIADGKIIQTHRIANIPYAVNCINHTDSSLIYWELTHETVYNINELVLDEEMIPSNRHLFMLGELRGSVIVAHECLKKAIEENGIRGFDFCTPADFVL